MYFRYAPIHAFPAVRIMILIRIRSDISERYVASWAASSFKRAPEPLFISKKITPKKGLEKVRT
jgi:hypothetical protein